jgi:hypothetical protein
MPYDVDELDDFQDPFVTTQDPDPQNSNQNGQASDPIASQNDGETTLIATPLPSPSLNAGTLLSQAPSPSIDTGLGQEWSLNQGSGWFGNILKGIGNALGFGSTMTPQAGPPGSGSTSGGASQSQVQTAKNTGQGKAVTSSLLSSPYLVIGLIALVAILVMRKK